MKKIHNRSLSMAKWQPFLLPEHRAGLKQLKKDDNSQPMPVLDQQQLEEFEEMICEAMGANNPLVITYLNKGKIEIVFGHVHYVDFLMKELRAVDLQSGIHYIKLCKVIDLRMYVS